MTTETKTLSMGKYTTRDGKQAEVHSVDTAKGLLIGLINIGTPEEPNWVGSVWLMNGRRNDVVMLPHDIGGESRIRIERTYWLNIYDNGPGLLRETWEQALVEASREEKQPLCRVEVKVEACVGDGLR
jgi:hypothetical protein